MFDVFVFHVLVTVFTVAQPVCLLAAFIPHSLITPRRWIKWTELNYIRKLSNPMYSTKMDFYHSRELFAADICIWTHVCPSGNDERLTLSMFPRAKLEQGTVIPD